MNATLQDKLAALVGARNCLTSPEDMAPFLFEERGSYQSQALCVIRPGSTEEVAGAVRLCAEAGVSLVPQGGNTGLVGGAVSKARQVLLSLQRLSKIRALDKQGRTMVAEAGVILANIQKAADEADLLFPLSLAAEGSCMLGGNLATNAGGTAVLRYGNARDLVLGLEVVLADGSIWNGLTALRKNNTGYDLKNLFVGSEGTLGIITAAVIRLFPKPREVSTAFAGAPSPAAVLELMERLQSASGESLTACEIIARRGLDFVLKHIPGVSDPLASQHPWYVLIELTSAREEGGLRDVMEAELGRAHEDGLIEDAVVAKTLMQREKLWKLRESLPEAQKHEGASLKHDVAVPVGRMPDFLARAEALVEAAVPGLRPCPFGHFGDGNVHFNLSQPLNMSKEAFLGRRDEIARAVHDLTLEMGGSFSAEHGVGLLKLPDMARYKSPVEMDLMRRVKKALDPSNILNPGKVVG